MIANIYNQNFGWSVASDGYWAAVGNPNSFMYDPLTGSICTGSVEVYYYNTTTDTHDVVTMLYRPLTSQQVVILSTEANNSGTMPATGPDWLLQTEYTGSIPYTADLLLAVDAGQYYSSIEDGYGWAIDLRDTLLAVGNPYYINLFSFQTASLYFTGSDYVDLYDLSTLAIDPYAKRIPPTIIGSGSVGGYLYMTVYVAPGQNYTSVLLQSQDNSSPNNPWINVSVETTSNSGGTITLPTGYTSLTGLNIRAVGIIGTNPYLTTIYSPNSIVTGSFGYSISLNDEWLAVGSPNDSSGSVASGSGTVYMFRKLNDNNFSWSFYQQLPTPSNIGPGDNFGQSIGLNKASGSVSWSMVVGSAKPSSSNAYIYQFNGTQWNNTTTLHPDSSSIYPVPFFPTYPIVQNYPNIADSFGYSVAMYGTSVIVGAPNDRIIYEYTGSSTYQQGAVYFFEQCAPSSSVAYYLARKSYGNENIMNNNMLGWSVSIYDQYAVAGVPKITALSSSICYLRGSLFQANFCGDDTEDTLCGQFVLYNKATGSIPDTTDVDWDISNIYQIKKRLLSPYREFGWSVDVSDQFIIVGAPMLISGSQTQMDLNYLTGSFTGSVEDIDALTGKAYIYNLLNLRPEIYVGNVFYRNGKVIIMTSGSNFEGLQLNDVTTDPSEYDITFTSQQTIYEKQVVCPVDVGEFNVSTNPSAVVLPNAPFDINENGRFDFQDADVILRYMAYQNTLATGVPNTDWTSSTIDTSTNEELAVYSMYSSSWSAVGTDALFSSSYSSINNNLNQTLDFTNDNRINQNDMFILWKYFIYRLTQKNYNSYITANSQNKYLADILTYINSYTFRGQPPMISQQFLDYPTLSSQDPTGSYLGPTVTSIGLYSGTELIAVAKLGSPIKITPCFPINFVVKIDF